MQLVPYWKLILISSLSILTGLLALWQHWSLHRQYWRATLRCFFQLLLLGHVLQIIFTYKSSILLLVALSIMTIAASFASTARMENPFTHQFWYNLFALILSTWPVSLLCLVLLEGEQMIRPHIFLPFVGMILGNSLNGIGLGIERFTSEILQHKQEILLSLSFGASSREAAAHAFRQAMKVSMTPILNSMSVAGIVSIPGMMSGQILAGFSPIESSKYQYAVMVTISCSIFLGSFIGTWLCYKKLFKHGSHLDFLLGQH